MTDCCWTLDPDAFIERCIMAIGGLDALRNAKTVSIVAERTRHGDVDTPTVFEVHTHRAFGGRIRIEERTAESEPDVFIVNGLSGCRINRDGTRPLETPEIEAIKRGVRLYPRNFLAHAAEHHFCGPERAAHDATAGYVLHLPTENFQFHFSAETFLCHFADDAAQGVQTFYEDYRSSAEGIVTAHLERRFRNGRLFETDRLLRLEFNAELDERLFHVA
jgi:hypothetical protein